MWDIRSDDSGQFNRAPSESLDEWILRVAAHRSSDLTSKSKVLFDVQGKDLIRDIQHLFSVKTTERLKENLEDSDDKAEIELQKKRGEEMRKILPRLVQLWWVNSEQLDFASEKLADGCRDSQWRIPIGEAGIFKFFLEILSRHDLRHILKIHILRLIGNCCADTDENRAHIAASKNYITSIIEQLKDVSMLPFALPVLFNICVDYVPNQLIAVNSFLSRELITLISSSSFDRTQPLLDYVGQILALLVSQSSEAEFAPVDIAAVLFRITADKKSPIGLDNFISFISTAISYLQNAKFQRAFISANGSLKDVVTILEDSYERYDIQSNFNEIHDAKVLLNLRNELNQVLSDISALPEFIEACPISSDFSNTLQQWLVAPHPKIQLQVCACIMLGNLARSDTVCIEFIHTLQIHKSLITIANRETSSQILHAILGFLKNLAIPLENKKPIGEAGIFQALARLWALDTVTQVQFSAISLARQLTIGTFENVRRLIQESTSNEAEGILSHLGNLFSRTDDEPIKMEIGRLTASICRVLYSRNESSWEVTHTTRVHFFRMHPEISNQLKFIVSQKKWPVVRSEGWFVLALISRFTEGSAFVSQLLQDSAFFELLSELFTGNPVIGPMNSSASRTSDSVIHNYTHHDPEPVKPHAQVAEMARLDLENAIVLVSENLQNSSSKMTTSQKMKLSSLLKNNGNIFINYSESKVEAHKIMS